MLKSAALLAGLLLLQGSAQAEWFARCQGGNQAACFGEACGSTPDEARNRCLEICPGSDTHSVGISSCTVQKPTQTPRVRSTPPTPGDGASLLQRVQ
ncbi:MAG: hypothetical protein U1E62_20010 [Alsobacter sp.]